MIARFAAGLSPRPACPEPRPLSPRWAGREGLVPIAIAGLLPLALAMLASGCSVFNAPDIDFLDTPPNVIDLGPPVPPTEGGPDVADMADMAEPDAGDAGPDAADMFRPPPIEICDNLGADEDGDRFADCADSDCFADFTHCCGGRATTMHAYPFDSEGVNSDFWVSSPSTARATPDGSSVESVQGGAMILRASGGASAQCVPMDSGARLDVVLTMRDGPDLGGSFGVTLTRARQSGGVEPLPAELRVAVEDGRRVVVEQAGIERTAMVVDDGITEVTVTIELTPSVTPIGTAGLLAQVTSLPPGLETLTSPIYIEHLVESEAIGMATQPCTLDTTAGAGLYVALEGQPTDATLRSLVLQPAACVSPSVWTRDRDLRTDAAQMLTGVTAIGDVGFVVGDPAARRDWYVMADITNGDPDAEDILFVPWALSMLYSPTGGTYERPRDMATMLPFNEPVVGGMLCGPGLCASYASNREAEMTVSTERVYLLAAFACEGSTYGQYDVCIGQQLLSNTSGRTLEHIRLATPPPYVSMRAPAIAALDERVSGPARTQILRIFAVAEDADGVQQVVSDSVTVVDSGEGDPVATFSGTYRVLFTADELGPIARKGLRSLSVLYEPDPDPMVEGTYRLWFVTESPGEASISYAAVTFAEDGTPTTQIYGANPILRAGAGALTLCRDTDDEGCKIRGLSVTHDPGSTDEGRLSMLVSYDEPGLDPSSRLITLFQPFRGTAR